MLVQYCVFTVVNIFFLLLIVKFGLWTFVLVENVDYFLPFVVGLHAMVVFREVVLAGVIKVILLLTIWLHFPHKQRYYSKNFNFWLQQTASN